MISLDGTRYHFKMYDEEWSVVFERREVALARKCETCGAIPKKDTGFCHRSEISVYEIERAEYWRGEISEELKERMTKQIRKELKHGKRICWVCEEEAFEKFLQRYSARKSFDTERRAKFGD